MNASKKHLVAVRGALVLALSVLVLALTVPMAHAATLTYWNGSASANQVKYSGMLASIAGGTSKTGLGGGTSTIITYKDYPGYSEIGHATGNNPHVSRLRHTGTSSVKSKCYWYWAGVGGSTTLTCTATV